MLVIAHPSDPKWEATVDGGSPLLEPSEIEAIDDFVRAGGGLIVLGETEQDKYGSNLNELLSRFDVRIESATVQDYEHHHGDAPSWVLASLGDTLTGRRPAGPDPLAGVEAACFYRAGVLSAAENGARVIARSQPTSSLPNAPLAVVVPHGEGRVVVTSDSDLFGDDCIADLDHETLWLNLVFWTAQPAFAADGADTRVARSPSIPRGPGSRRRSRSSAWPRPPTARSTPRTATRRPCASSPSRSPTRRRR